MNKSVFAVAVGAIGLTACSSSLVGTWKSEDAAAKPKDNTFILKQIQFQENKKYLASARTGQKHLFLSGSYEFNGKTLRLKSDGRADRIFNAMVWWGRELRLAAEGYQQTLSRQ